MTTISDFSWRINANGSQGILVLFSDDNINLVGTVAFDDIGGRVDQVTGTWDDAAGRIAFTRLLPGDAVQDYVGFLGDNHPPRLILAGSFTESDVPPDSPSFAVRLGRLHRVRQLAQAYIDRRDGGTTLVPQARVSGFPARRSA